MGKSKLNPTLKRQMLEQLATLANLDPKDVRVLDRLDELLGDDLDRMSAEQAGKSASELVGEAYAGSQTTQRHTDRQQPGRQADPTKTGKDLVEEYYRSQKED